MANLSVLTSSLAKEDWSTPTTWSIPNSTEITNEPMKTTLFHIYHNDEFHSAARYSSLRSMHDALKRDFPQVESIQFPPKQLLWLSPQKIIQRRIKLEIYLQTIGELNDVAASDIFNDFLQQFKEIARKYDLQQRGGGSANPNITVFDGEPLPTCLSGHTMKLSVCSDGAYKQGWFCDSCVTSNANRGPRKGKRWFCKECKEDLCFECVSQHSALSDGRTISQESFDSPPRPQRNLNFGDDGFSKDMKKHGLPHRRLSGSVVQIKHSMLPPELDVDVFAQNFGQGKEQSRVSGTPPSTPPLHPCTTTDNYDCNKRNKHLRANNTSYSSDNDHDNDDADDDKANDNHIDDDDHNNDNKNNNNSNINLSSPNLTKATALRKHQRHERHQLLHQPHMRRRQHPPQPLIPRHALHCQQSRKTNY
eukprot:m.163198 g.163198  ORF g.163198 m.163198 type:complete len:420 (-) comp31281_c1_seq1:173-1432(-)